MKKNLFFITMAMLLTSVAWSQNWVGFTKSEPNSPELNLLSSNAKTVSFEVTISGIYATDTVVNGTVFKRLILPEGGAVNPAGFPELPVLSYKVAIPECAGVEIESRIQSTQLMQSCWVYPVPQIVPDQNGTPVEQFTFNADAYAQLRSPEPVAVVSSSGAFRAQRYVEIIVQPVEFCPVTHQLTILDKIEVTLTFNNPTSDIRQNVGIFNKVAANAFINYEDDGMSALVNDKAFEMSGFTRGNVQWINLTNTAEASQIVADYIIITVPEFFTPNDPNSQLARLSNHRAWYNGYDVAILNVNNILSLNFSYENPLPEFKDEQRIRTCIRLIYEGKNAHHTRDGKLGYVLLVGDYANGIGIPGPTEHGIGDEIYFPEFGDQIYRSDYYYTCITKNGVGKYDEFGELCIGRFSVEDTPQLFNMVQKTIFHETDFSNMSWRKKAGFTNIFAYDYEENIVYFNIIDNLLNNYGWTYSKVVAYNPTFDIKIPTMNYFNAGAAFVQYLGLCPDPYNSWSDNLNISYFRDSLRNDYMAPFVSSVGAPTSWFDDVESLGEFLTRYHPSKGAVGCIGPSRYVNVQNLLASGKIYQEWLLRYIFEERISVVGESLLTFKLSDNSPTKKLERKYAYNILGDPALNILADPECPKVISTTQYITNGNTLKVPNNCAMRILQTGKLIIEKGATLIIEDNAKIFGEDCKEDITIHIKGGDLIVGNNVTFNNLNGIFLEGYKPVHDASKQFNLSNVTFNNTPITHIGTQLNLSNCTFSNRSDIVSDYSIVDINNCSFSKSGFKSGIPNGALYPLAFTPFVKITNSSFRNTGKFIYGYEDDNPVPTGSAPLYSSASIMLRSIPEFEITGDTIINANAAKGEPGGPLQPQQAPFGEGIYLNIAGYGNADNRVVSGNDISQCETGIYVYCAKGAFKNNNIHDNKYGVRLFNNSSTSFLGETAIANGEQFIRDNDSYEIYASQNAFPYPFKYNQIIDEDNLGNVKDDPLLYYDNSAKGIDPGSGGPQLCVGIPYNYWGENFVHNEDIYPPASFCTSPVWIPSKGASSPEEELYETAIEYFALENYASAKTAFLNLIETYPESQFAIISLHELFALEQFMDNDYLSLQNYYATFTPADSNLFSVAEFLSTRCYVQERFWQPAIDWYENRIENPPSYQDSVFAVIDLGDIHLMMEADTAGNGAKGAAACYYRFPEMKPKSKQEYETNKTDLLATLPQIKKPKTENLHNPLDNRKGVLGQNIPNPATGTTTITYGINTEGTVSIGIYNAMGQLVKTFPQGTLKEGTYHAKISLAGISAGIYSYVLLVNGERADAKKMVVKP